MALVEVSDVLDRLSKTPGLDLPSTLTAERLQAYVDEASAQALAKTGRTTAPSSGTVARQALAGACLRLVTNAVMADLMATDPNMREVLRRERNDILDEVEGVAQDVEPAGGAFFTLAGGR